MFSSIDMVMILIITENTRRTVGGGFISVLLRLLPFGGNSRFGYIGYIVCNKCNTLLSDSATVAHT